MYISISEIPPGGMDVVATRGAAWVSTALDGMNPYPLASCKLTSADLHLTVEKEDVFARGSYSAEGEGECDRCLEKASIRLEGDFVLFIVPESEVPSGSSHVELHGADLDLAFHDGVGVEAVDIFREQVALALPEKFLCREECKGLCQKCGVNKNEKTCDCPEGGRLSPFEALNRLKEDGKE